VLDGALAQAATSGNKSAIEIAERVVVMISMKVQMKGMPLATHDGE
jgi:hypothetical protein